MAQDAADFLWVQEEFFDFWRKVCLVDRDVRKQKQNSTAIGAGRMIGATTVALLVLLISFLAVDIHAHEAVHEDAHQPEHECVITLFAQGQVTGFSPPITVLDVPPSRCVTILRTATPVLSNRRYLLPPSCGPPAAV